MKKNKYFVSVDPYDENTTKNSQGIIFQITDDKLIYHKIDNDKIKTFQDDVQKMVDFIKSNYDFVPIKKCPEAFYLKRKENKLETKDVTTPITKDTVNKLFYNFWKKFR